MGKRKFRIDFASKTDHSIEYLKGIATDTRIVTLQLLQKLTTDEIDWQYQPGWNTIGALLDHIAAVQQFFIIQYLEDRQPTDSENERLLPALDMGVHLPKLIGIKSIDEYRLSLIASQDVFLNALSKLSFADFTKTIEGYDEVEGCNLAWVLYHMVEDEIYHRGQISLIRKVFKAQNLIT